MAEQGTRRLGKLETGVVKDDATGREAVSATPVVLWAGTEPRVVLALRQDDSAVTDRGTESFERVEGSGGPFPIEAKYALDGHDGFDLAQVHTLDLDGDGVDELVLVRVRGEVEVVGAAKPLARLALPSTAQARFEVVSSQRARIGGHDILFLAFARRDDRGAAKAGAAALETSAVVRVDAQGATLLKLDPAITRDGEVLAVGALNRPGSKAVDEVLILFARGEQVFLSRHRTDGALLEPPRKAYLPIEPTPPAELAFLPQSATAVLLHRGEQAAYFIDAAKPANWLERVDLAPAEPDEILGIVDAVRDPKAVLRRGDALFAVNHAGIWFGWAGGFTPAKGVAPLLRLAPPGPGLELVGVYAAEGPAAADDLLVVHTRKRGLRVDSLEELIQAAERFLPAPKVAFMKEELAPSLMGRDALRDSELEKEMAAKGVTEPPRTVEEWQARFPASYQAVAAWKRQSFVTSARGELTRILNPKVPSRDFQQPEELKAWLAARDQPSETVIELYRGGARLASARTPGWFDRTAATALSRPRVSHKSSTAGAVAVLALGSGDKADKGRAAFYLVTLTAAR